MGGTSYESNNVFKLISRSIHNNSNQGHKEKSLSPPLKPIEEVVQKKNAADKIIAAASNTQSKFYINQQSRNVAIVNIQKGGRGNGAKT